MNLKIFNLESSKDISNIVTIMNAVLNEFPELQEKITTLALILATHDKFESGKVTEKIKQFLSTKETIKVSNNDVSCGSISNKGYITIIIEKFQNFPDWKKYFVLRHECSHLLLHSSFLSPTAEELSYIIPKMKKGKSSDFISKMREAIHEYQVHILMIERYPEDWFKEPRRILETVGSPRRWYRTRKKRFGLDQALIDSILNSFQILRHIYLNEHILNNFDYTKPFKNDLLRYNSYLDSLWNCIQKDSKGILPPPKEWIQIDDLQEEEKFFQKVFYLLKLCFGDSNIKKRAEKK